MCRAVSHFTLVVEITVVWAFPSKARILRALVVGGRSGFSLRLKTANLLTSVNA